VPVGHDAGANVEVRRWGSPPKFDFKPRPHWEIAEAAGNSGFPASPQKLPARVSRSTEASVLGWSADWRLFSRYACHPRLHGNSAAFIVNTAALTGVGQLPKFAADMFHLEGTDLWLTPTSEVELTSMYQRRNARCRFAACQSMCLDGVLSFRSRSSRKKDTRGLKRQASIPKRWNVFKFTQAGTKLTKNRNPWLPMPSACCKNWVCTTASCCSARATWVSRRQKLMILRSGCLLPNEFMEIFFLLELRKRFRRGRSGIRFKPKAAKSGIRAYIEWFGTRWWGARGSPSLENYQQADGSVIIPEALRPYVGTDRIPAKALTPARYLSPQKKGPRTRKSAALSQIWQRQPKLHFSMVILSTWMVSPSVIFPVTFHFHAEILIRVHAILIFDFHDFLDLASTKTSEAFFCLRHCNVHCFPAAVPAF